VRPSLIAAALLLTLPCTPKPASAQPQPTAPPGVAAPPISTVAGDAAQPHVAAGTPVAIELAELVSSKTHKRGDNFALRLALPILLDGKVVVPAGTTGVGQVVDAAASGPLGRPAKLLLAARYLDFNGGQIPLRGLQLGRAGKDKSDTVMAVSFAPYVGVLGLFMHGGEIEIPAGQRAQAKLAADLSPPSPPATPAPPGANPPAEGPRQP